MQYGRGLNVFASQFYYGNRSEDTEDHELKYSNTIYVNIYNKEGYSGAKWRINKAPFMICNEVTLTG